MRASLVILAVVGISVSVYSAPANAAESEMCKEQKNALESYRDNDTAQNEARKACEELRTFGCETPIWCEFCFSTIDIDSNYAALSVAIAMKAGKAMEWPDGTGGGGTDPGKGYTKADKHQEHVDEERGTGTVLTNLISRRLVLIKDALPTSKNPDPQKTFKSVCDAIKAKAPVSEK